MAKQILSEEFRRMQKLAGIITEEQLEEMSTGDLDPKVLFDFIKKYEDKFKEIEANIEDEEEDKWEKEKSRLIDKLRIMNKNWEREKKKYKL
jgi:hypothetical protein